MVTFMSIIKTKYFFYLISITVLSTHDSSFYHPLFFIFYCHLSIYFFAVYLQYLHHILTLFHLFLLPPQIPYLKTPALTFNCTTILPHTPSAFLIDNNWFLHIIFISTIYITIWIILILLTNMIWFVQTSIYPYFI